ncbi:MAG: hypothetical protein U0R19_30015 [Bryobacteraceae bacterium]
MPPKDPNSKQPSVIPTAIRRQAAVLQPKQSRSALLLPGEDPAKLQTLYAGYYEHFRPTTIVETTLVDEMVSAIWRFNRNIGYESMLLTEQAEELIAEHKKSYAVADMHRLFAHATQSATAGMTQLTRTLIACRNTFRGALSDLEKARKLKGDPAQPFLPPPCKLSAATNFAEPTPPPKKNVIEMPLPVPRTEPVIQPVAETQPPPPDEQQPEPPSQSESLNQRFTPKREWFESEDYVPPPPQPEPKPEPPPAFHDINGNPITIHKQEKPTFTPNDFKLTTSPETAEFFRDLLKHKK